MSSIQTRAISVLRRSIAANQPTIPHMYANTRLKLTLILSTKRSLGSLETLLFKANIEELEQPRIGPNQDGDERRRRLAFRFGKLRAPPAPTLIACAALVAELPISTIMAGWLA